MSVTIDAAEISRLMNLLGDSDGDLCFFLPCGETLGAGADVQDSSSRGLHGTNPVARDFPSVIRGGLMSPRYNDGVVIDEYLTIGNNILLTPISGGVDAPFSVGCAFKMDAVQVIPQRLISKIDEGVAETWSLHLDALERVNFILYDDNAAASDGRRDDAVLVVDTWYVAIGTYDGRGGADAQNGISIYLYTDGVGWGGAVDDTDVTVGAYVDMEDLATPVMIGAFDDGGVVDEVLHGELMMPWYTRRELSAEGAELVARQMVRIMEL